MYFKNSPCKEHVFIKEVMFSIFIFHESYSKISVLLTIISDKVYNLKTSKYMEMNRKPYLQ